jgi:hypothetical protein
MVIFVFPLLACPTTGGYSEKGIKGWLRNLHLWINISNLTDSFNLFHPNPKSIIIISFKKVLKNN